MSQITFQNKVTLNPKPEVAEINKVTADNLNEIKDVVNSNATNTNNNFSDAYSTSTTYNVGDYCIYQDKLYKCITAITTPESFTSSKWEKTTVTDNLIRYYHYSTPIVSGTLNSGGWRKIYSDVTTDEIDVGTYLLLIPFTLQGFSSSVGVASGRATINGSEISTSSRQSIPINNLLLSQTIIAIWNVTQKQAYTLNCEIYSSMNFTTRTTSGISIIKIK